MNSRLHYMDSLRSILMMLGVVLHSSLVFMPDREWIIHAPDTTIIATYIHEVVHFFRMPAFFIVSGFFAIFTLEKYSPRKFLTMRIARLVIPLIVSILTINSLQEYILVSFGWNTFELKEYIYSAKWIQHLWFLINLTIYFVVIALIYKFFKPLLYKIFRVCEILFSRTNIYFLFALFALFVPFSNGAMSILSKFIYIGGSAVNLNSIAYFFVYFSFGLLLYKSKGTREKFISISPLWSLVALAVPLLLLQLDLPLGKNIGKVFYLFYVGFAQFVASALVFSLFHRFLNKKSKLFYFLSDASYTVYLFHQVIIVVLGSLLIKYHIGGLLGLTVLILLTATFALFIHKFAISRFKSLSFLYNGKSKR